MLSDAIGSALQNARRVPRPRMWGEEFLDQTLALLYAPRSWDDVAADELAFLIPSLCSPQAGLHRREACAILLRRALAARVFEYAYQAPSAVGAPAGTPDALDVVFHSGVVTTLSRRECLLQSVEAWQELYGARKAAPLRLRRTPSVPSAAAYNELQVFELSILASLNRMASDTIASPHVGTHGREPISLADALVGSIYASFNAAYLYPHLVCMHELLTVGAWLGYLVRRRDALMPTFIAERLVDHLERESADEQSEADRCECLIHLHAELIGGRGQLLEQARRVERTGRPQRVRPSRTGYPEGLRLVIWNDTLAKRLQGQLDVSG